MQMCSVWMWSTLFCIITLYWWTPICWQPWALAAGHHCPPFMVCCDLSGAHNPWYAMVHKNATPFCWQPGD
eukprot:1156475-Pelagomonas_calceolata.AAC.10